MEGSLNIWRTLIRKGALDKCAVERLLASGLIAQVQAIHVNSGGDDARKLKQKRLLKSGGPQFSVLRHLRNPRGRSTRAVCVRTLAALQRGRIIASEMLVRLQAASASLWEPVMTTGNAWQT